MAHYTLGGANKIILKLYMKHITIIAFFISTLVSSQIGIKSLDEALKNPNKVTHLNLSYQNLKSIPESISRLKNLTSLSLSHNNLDSLPKSIVKLKKLKVLILGSNAFETYPEIINDL